MWGQIAQAVSGAIQSKAKTNEVKPLEVGDYGHSASALPTQNNEPQKPEVKQEEVKTEVKQEESKEPEKDTNELGSLMDSISDGNAKDKTDSVGKKSSWAEKKEKIQDVLEVAGQIGDTLKKFQNNGSNNQSNIQPIAVGNYGSPAVSDGTLKNKEKIERLFQNDNAIKAFSDIDAYVYKYNQKAQDTYAGEKGVDDETHFGPIAQDLAKNPVTSGTVHRDESGYLTVDTRQLALTNTAMISQLARKIEELEERIGGR